ncbi:MAG: galactokinase [Clostridiales bacterium]|nr:galactokinase [Clostridiales bacterium]
MKTYKLVDIYGKDLVDFQKKRYEKAIENFKALYGNIPFRIFSAPGRTEVGGNHTDHNHGKVLAAGVSLDVIAIVGTCDNNAIQIKSEGFPEDIVDISNLEVVKTDINSSASLIRGVADGFFKNGYSIGGFKAYTTSNVLKGSGLSSSAAFEVLVGTILNYLYNNAEVSPVKIAQIAQYAENVHFGKPSGLMDQMASSVGSFITIDFADTENPIVNSVSFDFSKVGYNLCIVDTKGNHADLTPEYASIPTEMKSVAGCFQKNYLREITKDQLLENIVEVRQKCGDRAVLRALHFFDDNQRVEREFLALSEGRFDDFLTEVNNSGNSSYKYLQNIYAPSAPHEQGLSIGLYNAQSILDGEGACRVHGGGFAGTIQAFVPNSKLDKFKTEMDRIFGEDSCHVLSIRPVGGAEISL